MLILKNTPLSQLEAQTLKNSKTFKGWPIANYSHVGYDEDYNYLFHIEIQISQENGLRFLETFSPQDFQTEAPNNPNENILDAFPQPPNEELEIVRTNAQNDRRIVLGTRRRRRYLGISKFVKTRFLNINQIGRRFRASELLAALKAYDSAYEDLTIWELKANLASKKTYPFLSYETGIIRSADYDQIYTFTNPSLYRQSLRRIRRHTNA